MRTHLKLLLLTGFLFAQNGLPYISPGVQLGINSKGKIFTSAQITIGYVGPTPPIGVTIGKRWYHLNQEKKVIVIMIFKCGLFFWDRCRANNR